MFMLLSEMLIFILLFILLFFVVIYYIKHKIRNEQISFEKILNDTKKEAEYMQDYYKRYKDIQFLEEKLKNEKNILDEKIKSTEKLEQTVKNKIQEYDTKLLKIKSIKNQELKELEKVSRMTSKEAEKKMIELLENDLTREKATSIINFQEKLKSEKEKLAREILADAVLRYSSDYVYETSVSVVRLPSDEIKGCIIGREGRNIRALELLTGVDFIIDDTPETITLSSFDPYKREVAKTAIALLISDGRIQPTKIEEMIEKAKKQMEKDMKNEAQKIIFDLQIGEVNDEIMETLGRLKYRTSYGQNALQHSVEVAYISGLLASEMGVDAKIAKRCGLFHDIGKALTYTMEGSHVELGTKFLSKYSEPKEVLNTVASHHGDCKPESIMAIIVKAADTISASRPGARRENLESYTRRIEKLENIVNNFEEVERCYVIQAGREVRVVVSPDKVTDDGMVVIARNICKKIEENLNYPGQIRVSMLRENRIIEYAK